MENTSEQAQVHPVCATVYNERQEKKDAHIELKLFAEDDMNKTDVLETIQSAHTSLEELLAPLSERQFCTANLEGQRSLKDILAHIAAWERLCADSMAELVHGQLPCLPEEDDDTINEQILLENRDRSLHEVQEDFRDAYQHLLRQVGVLFQILPEEDLNDPRRFPWLEGHSLLAFIAGNSYDHYVEHAEQIRAWLHASKAQEYINANQEQSHQ